MLRQVADSEHIPSFEDFKKKSGMRKSERTVNEDDVKRGAGIPSLREYAKKGAGVSVSPLVGGNQAKVSGEARRNALEFTYPVDQFIIRMLDSTSIGKFAKFNMQHPIIPKRIKALDLFSKSAMYGKYIGQTIDADSLSWEQLAKETEKIIEVEGAKYNGPQLRNCN